APERRRRTCVTRTRLARFFGVFGALIPSYTGRRMGGIRWSRWSRARCAHVEGPPRRWRRGRLLRPVRSGVGRVGIARTLDGRSVLGDATNATATLARFLGVRHTQPERLAEARAVVSSQPPTGWNAVIRGARAQRRPGASQLGRVGGS